MILRAAFFDRDNTLLHMDPALRAARTAKIEGWTGRPYHQTYEEMMELFRRAGYPEEGLKSVQEEIRFWRRYYRELLEEEGVTDCLEERAEELWDMTWLKGYQLFPETREVLDWFRSRGVRMGVISDTSPSLPLTLEAAGIGFPGGGAGASPHPPETSPLPPGPPFGEGGAGPLHPGGPVRPPGVRPGGGEPLCGRLRRGGRRGQDAGLYRFPY